LLDPDEREKLQAEQRRQEAANAKVQTKKE
jgi:hypothetical protein